MSTTADRAIESWQRIGDQVLDTPAQMITTAGDHPQPVRDLAARTTR